MNIDEFMEFDDNYYGHFFGFHTKRTSCLYDYSRLYNGIPWKYSKSVQEDDKISYLQVVYALSEITGKFLYQTIKAYIEKLNDFAAIFQKDEFGRLYVTFSDYKKYAKTHKKLFKLEGVKKKEVDLWLLRL